jgi:hypothetical protein
MQRLSLVLCVLGLMTAPLEAGTITYNFGGTTVTRTTNATQDAKLTRLLAKENLLRAARTPPDAALTLEQYLDQILIADLVARNQQADSYEKGDFCTVFPTLTQAQRNQIMTTGGNNNPCP